MEPTSCSGCWSFLSPFVVLTFFPLLTLLLTASVEATGKQITVNSLPCVHKKFTGNETCTCPPPTPTKIKILALLVPFNNFYQVLQYKSWIDVSAIHFRYAFFKFVSESWLVSSVSIWMWGSLALFEGRGRLYKRGTAREKRVQKEARGVLGVSPRFSRYQ